MSSRIGTAPLKVRAAVATVDITPPVGIHLHNWAYSERVTATGVHQPLLATLVAFDVNGSRSLVVALDLGWWMERSDEARLREAIGHAAGLPFNNLIVALTHTHSGPSICRQDADLPGGYLVAPYLDRIETEVAREAASLFKHLRPCLLEWTAGSCTLAFNRDLYLPDERRHVVGANPAGEADTTLMVGRLTDLDDGATKAVIANYAVHPISLGGDNSLLSPDFVGSARQLVAEFVGAPLLFLQGASGDLAPLQHYSGNPQVAEDNGMILGHAILSTLHGMLPAGTGLAYAETIESGAPLGTYRQEVMEPSVRMQCTTIGLAFPTKDNPPPSGGNERVRADRQVRAARIRGNARTDVINFPVTVWELGEATIFAYPGEAYSELQTSLRKEFPNKTLLFVNLANGPHCGYIAPRRAYDDRLYPAWQSPLASQCFDFLVDGCRRYLASRSKISASTPNEREDV